MIFLSWIKYQRRNSTICDRFPIKPIFIHYKWQNKSLFHKVLSTILKCVSTLKILNKSNSIVFVQIPSVFLLYVITCYRLFSPNRFIVADCHNNIFYDSKWSKFPFVVYCLAKLNVVLVHNACVLKYMDDKFKTLDNLEIVRDLIPKIQGDLEKLEISDYIFIPCSLGNDEPVREMVEAISSLENIKFVITKTPEQLLSRLPSGTVIPDNLNFTGYLSENDFNTYLLGCSAVLVLTKREGTQPSGAVEALAAKKITILSDLVTTRLLFPDVSCFCDNTSHGIASAVLRACAKPDLNFDQIIYEYEKQSIERLTEILGYE